MRQIHEDQPQIGHYRYRKHKDARWEPCAIWMHQGQLVCRISERMVDVHDVWTWVAGNKMPKDEVMYAFKSGGQWLGDAPAPIGHNAQSDDPFENLTREVEAEAMRVQAWIAEPHEGKTAADMAANWLTELRRAEKRVEAAFDVEKAPVLAETQRIDAKWRGLKALAAQIKRVMDERYQAIARKEKVRLQTIADAKAQQEAEAKRKEYEADQERKAALAREHNLPAEPVEPELFPVVTEAPPVRVAFGGSTGSRVGIRKTKATAHITDWAKAAVHYAANPTIRAAVQKLADHDARDGRPFDGMTIIPGE